MRKILSAVALALAVASPAIAKDDSTFYGRIVHVSSNNLKVQSKSGQILSFLILPKWKNIWSDDGKTTYQMSFLHNRDAGRSSLRPKLHRRTSRGQNYRSTSSSDVDLG